MVNPNTAPVMMLTGGLDSYIIWRLLGKPEAIYFKLHTSAMKQELRSLEHIRECFRESKIHFSDAINLREFEITGGYVPYRNLLLLLHTSLMFRDRPIIIGQVREWQTDKNRKFYRQMEQIFYRLGYYRRNRILAPYSRYTKTDLVREFIKQGFDPKELTAFTYSCVLGSNRDDQLPCGVCSNCLNRYIALKNNGLSEETVTVPTWETWKDNAYRQKGKFHITHIFMYLRNYLDARKAFKTNKTNKTNKNVDDIWV